MPPREEDAIDITVVIHDLPGTRERYIWIATPATLPQVRTHAQEFARREELAFTQRDAESVVKKLDVIERKLSEKRSKDHSKPGGDLPGDNTGPDPKHPGA